MASSSDAKERAFHRTQTHILIRRLWHDYIAKHTVKIILAVTCMMIAAAMTAANAWIMQPVLDEIFVNQNKDMLTVIPLAVAAIAIISGMANYGQNIIMKFVGQRVIADMQISLFDHLIKADIGLLHEHSSGRLISRFTNDITMMRHSISNVLTGLAKELLTMLFLLGLMIYQSWELSIIALVAIPLAVFPIVRLGRRMRKISDGTQKELGEFTAQLDETFQGARVVKAYRRESFEIERASNSIERLLGLYFKAARVQSIASPLMETLGGFAIAIVIWYGGFQVLSGHTTPGAFFSFMTALVMVYKPIKSIANMNTHLQEGLAAANRFFGMIDTRPAITDKPGATDLQVTDAHLVLDNVTFHYGEKEAGVRHISMNIPAGKTAALVGPSGGGKSTIMNLILRFYDIEKGAITIDGQDIRNVTLASLRDQIALVSQDIILFDDTVRGNIAYGNPDASQDELIEAARRADAHDFISALPNGYDTMIGPHGVKLSGGQRQRICIARAMLKNAPILLLDEATSSLDSESERCVQEALEALMKNRTTLVIAHRLSTIQHADVIYVVAQGEIVEHGTHKELLKHKGRYKQLYDTQFHR